MSVCTGGRYGWVDRVVEKMEEKNRLNMVRVEFHEGKLRQGWGFGVFSEGSVTICRGTRQESYWTGDDGVSSLIARRGYDSKP